MKKKIKKKWPKYSGWSAAATQALLPALADIIIRCESNVLIIIHTRQNIFVSVNPDTVLKEMARSLRR